MNTILKGQAFRLFTEGTVFAAFDLETTGLDPKTNKIVEIGAVKFDKKGIVARFSTLINPDMPMPAEAARVNKISDEMLKGKPTINEVLPDFFYFINGAALIAHNAPFDLGFIDEAINKAFMKPLPNPVADTLSISRQLFPDLTSHSLQNMAAFFKIDALDAHRAEDDARLCMEIFLRCVR